MKVDKRKLDIAMARAQLSQKDLAKKAGMPISTLYTVTQRKSLRPATIGRVAAALGVDVTEIIED